MISNVVMLKDYLALCDDCEGQGGRLTGVGPTEPSYFLCDVCEGYGIAELDAGQRFIDIKRGKFLTIGEADAYGCFEITYDDGTISWINAEDALETLIHTER